MVTMKTTSVTAHYERKLNTGNYSSATLSAWATVEVEPGDNDGDALAYAMGLCRQMVKDAAQPFVKSNGKVSTPAPDAEPALEQRDELFELEPAQGPGAFSEA